MTSVVLYFFADKLKKVFKRDVTVVLGQSFGRRGVLRPISRFACYGTISIHSLIRMGASSCTGSSSIFHCAQFCLWYTNTVCWNQWLSLIHPTLIPPGFTAALCLISCVHSEKCRAQTLLQGCACRAAGSEAGHTTPNAQKTFSACVVQVVSVQQRYPARELKFQGNSLSETKNMYKSSSNITLNQAKHFFKHLSSFI